MYHILEAIQKNLGFPALQKIDSNTQVARGQEKAYQTNSLGQAVIPAVVCAFFNYIFIRRPAASFLQKDANELLSLLFWEKTGRND
jgi:hypothetical protein